jgi:hypothetical protein
MRVQFRTEGDLTPGLRRNLIVDTDDKTVTLVGADDQLVGTDERYGLIVGVDDKVSAQTGSEVAFSSELDAHCGQKSTTEGGPPATAKS